MIIGFGEGSVCRSFLNTATDQNGSYLEDCKVQNEAAAPYALDHTEAEKLWALSEHLVGQKFSY